MERVVSLTFVVIPRKREDIHNRTWMIVTTVMKIDVIPLYKTTNAMTFRSDIVGHDVETVTGHPMLGFPGSRMPLE